MSVFTTKSAVAVAMAAVFATALAQAPAKNVGTRESWSVDHGGELRVRFADLNLSKPADVETLYQRVRRAARDICGSDASRWDGRTSLMNKCIAQTIEAAVQGIDKPQLSALYRERQKRAPAG